MLPWFRYYVEDLDDPRVQALPAELFKFWVNLHCVASRHDGKLPSKALAFHLRQDEQTIKDRLVELHEAGFLDRSKKGAYSPRNWSVRQYKSDSSTERVKRFRKRSRKRDRNASQGATETAKETDQIQRQTQKQTENPDPSSREKVSYSALSRGEGADLDPARDAADREAFESIDDDDWPPAELNDNDSQLPPAA